MNIDALHGPSSSAAGFSHDGGPRSAAAAPHDTSREDAAEGSRAGAVGYAAVAAFVLLCLVVGASGGSSEHADLGKSCLGFISSH